MIFTREQSRLLAACIVGAIRVCQDSHGFDRETLYSVVTLEVEKRLNENGI